MVRQYFSAFCLAAFISLCLAADLTRQPNAYGPEVVEAVVNIIRESCLFADDRRFLRRLAYVESHDGTDPKTFRYGYYGGIWQVDELEFRATQNVHALQVHYNLILNQMGINWNTVHWSDLRKPLYSGIAAALYTIIKSSPSGLDWRAEQQGYFWGHNFHGGSPATNFSNLAEILDLGCRPNQQIDLVFVLDTSSSLSSDDIFRAVHFMSEVVDGFNIGSTQTQVGVVSYSSSSRVEFYLNAYRDKSSLQNAILNIQQVAGNTRTDLGMDTALYNVFSLNGARSHVVKVMVVVTDGLSDDILNTRHAAERVHASAIVTFAVGVGSRTDDGELNSIASNPDCTHMYKVNSYEEIRFMKEEIQKATCLAPLIFNRTYSCEISSCPPLSTDGTCLGGVTIETNISCGGMAVYSSLNNPYPSSAQYEILQNSIPGSPTELYYNTTKPVFVNLKDNQAYSNASTGCIATITPYCGDHTNHPITVKCFQDHREIPCDPSYFNCTEKWNFPDPCSHANILAGKTRFPHPYESNKFLMCDLSGKLYVVICPEGELFVADCAQCIGASTPVSSRCTDRLPSTIANPCTRENILADKMFFEYPGDAHKYIHCDVWGHPWERNCQPGDEWDQVLQTCFVPAVGPCRHHVAGQPYLYPHGCDPHKYIHCDTNHQAFVQSCQLDYVFYKESQVCVIPGTYGTGNLVNTCYGYTGTAYGHQITTPYVNYGSTSGSANGYEYTTALYAAPCTKANIAIQNLYFPYRYNTHQYIQCDLFGRMYLRDCSGAGRDYYDPDSQTCVDGPVVGTGHIIG